MRSILAMARRDIRSQLTSGTPWAVAAAFLGLSGLLLWIDASDFADFSRRVAADPQALAALNTTVALVPAMASNLLLIAAFTVPFLTMRSLADERRNGTLDVLRTLPISDPQVIVGKYLALLGVGALLLGATLVQPLALFMAAPLDWSHVITAYLGVALAFTTLLAIGLAVSAWTPSTGVAVSTTFGLFIGLYILDIWVGTAPIGLAGFVARWSPITRLEPFTQGVLRLDAVAYYLFVDLVALTVASVALRLERRVG